MCRAAGLAQAEAISLADTICRKETGIHFYGGYKLDPGGVAGAV